MPDNQTDSAAQLAARLTELEHRYTLLQRTVEDLDGVLVSQARQIESLERKIAHLTNQLGALANRDDEPRTLEDDKPPHY